VLQASSLRMVRQEGKLAGALHKPCTRRVKSNSGKTTGRGYYAPCYSNIMYLYFIEDVTISVFTDRELIGSGYLRVTKEHPDI
jgi:hypothetical protein